MISVTISPNETISFHIPEPDNVEIHYDCGYLTVIKGSIFLNDGRMITQNEISTINQRSWIPGETPIPDLLTVTYSSSFVYKNRIMTVRPIARKNSLKPIEEKSHEIALETQSDKSNQDQLKQINEKGLDEIKISEQLRKDRKQKPRGCTPSELINRKTSWDNWKATTPGSQKQIKESGSLKQIKESGSLKQIKEIEIN